MRVTNFRPLTFAACFSVALLLVLPCRSEAGEKRAGQDENARARVLASAEKAIRSRKGAVFVVKIESSHLPRPRRSRRWFTVVFTVEEVVKPYRISKGAYWIPLRISEYAPDGKAKLRVGKRYVLVTGMDFWGLEIADWLMAPGGDEKLLQEIRTQTEKHAVYGSSLGLRNQLRGGPLGAGGVRTAHANGLVDPEPFGFKPDELRKAVSDGMSVLLVTSSPDNTMTGREWQVEVLERLAGPKPAKKKLWFFRRAKKKKLRVYRPETYEEFVARSSKLPAPYRLPRTRPGGRYIILVEPRDEGLPLLKAIMPVISDDGPTVRKIRSWLAKRPRSRPYNPVPADLPHLASTPPQHRRKIDELITTMCDPEAGIDSRPARERLVAIGKPAFPRILGKMAELRDQMSKKERLSPDEQIEQNLVLSSIVLCDRALRAIDGDLDSHDVKEIKVGHSRQYVAYICRQHYRRWLGELSKRSVMPGPAAPR